MEPPMKHKSSSVQVNTSGDEVKLGDENGLLIKRRRTEYSGVQPKQEMEDTDMENKVPDGLPVEVYTGKEPMDADCAVQSSGIVNDCSKAHVRAMFPTGNEPARLRLQKICTAIGWKEPSFDFEEQGPPHSKLYFCKVTVCLDGLVGSLIECFSGPKGKKKAAQEHAAQGALWYLERLGHVSDLQMRRPQAARLPAFLLP